MNTSLSIFARALASENLTFAFDPNAQTASFDVKARHLVMPMWDVSDTLRTMLVAHEISHALWTPYEVSNRLFDQAIAEGYNEKLLHHICNMIEDVRIEKLMKVKYPGTRRDFFLGYREIIDKNLFNLSSLDWNKVDMVSRLNGHFKWGVPGFLTIPLTDEEFALAAEVDAVETFEEAFDLAKRLYGHPSMEKARQKMQQEAEAMANGKGKGKGDEKGESEEGDGGTDLTNIGGAFAQKTGEECTIDNLIISPLSDISSAVIPASMVQAKYDQGYKNHNSNPPIDAYRKYVKESDAFVRQLVAQFERRKAADEIRRERPKQTGMLNLDRLHQYRTHDDIFLSKIIKQDGKNHGIMFLIDFSGSMGSTIGNCIHQVLQLVWFCEKAKIPFEVYGFTNLGGWGREQEIAKEREAYINANPDDEWGHRFRGSDHLIHENGKGKSIHYGDCRLITLASSRDSAADRERLLACVWGQFCTSTGVGCIPFGGTPTVEAVAIVSQVMRDWVTNNNIQIPTLMIVTDGQPGGIYTNDHSHSNAYINATHSLCVNNEIFGTVHYLAKNENEVDVPNMVIGMMLDALRKNLNARCVGMYVEYQRSLTDNLFRSMCVTRKEWREMQKGQRGHYAYDSMDMSPRYDACAEQFANGALILPKSTYPGYDAFFLIRSMKVVSDEEAIVDQGSFVKVKNTFVKTMGKRSSSRVFLTKYVDIVAGQPIRDEDEKMYRLPFMLTWEERNKLRKR